MNSGSDFVVEGRGNLSNESAEVRSSLVLVLIAVLILQIAVYYESYWSMVQTWWRSETFAHGFLIFPISLYLIWTRREALSKIANQPDYRALPLLLGCGFTWLLAHLADVLVIEQLAVVAMIPLIVWAVLGFQKAWAMAFPLAFMLFAVPAGEFLVPSMMEFTADFTVAAIELTGIPVFREGLFFTLPSGSWSVVEACSGVRYIIASLTLGCLYAYLTYHSYWRRLVFILLAIVAPIIANGLRAYMIVMIGHLSSMKLATGVDHLIYGWVWFGIVMFILFWLGGFWRDKPSESSENTDAQRSSNTNSHRRIITLAGTLFIILVWPVWSLYIDQLKANPGYVLAAPEVKQWIQVSTEENAWQPTYVEPSQLLHQSYQNQDVRVGLVLAYYENQRQGAELINSRNTLLAGNNQAWRQSKPSEKIDVGLSGQRFQVIEAQIKSNRGQLLVWRWNLINGVHTGNDYYGKAIEAWSQLKGASRSGTGVVLYTPFMDNDVEESRGRLQGFMKDVLPQLESKL